jgi:hypothetical protein
MNKAPVAALAGLCMSMLGCQSTPAAQAGSGETVAVATDPAATPPATAAAMPAGAAAATPPTAAGAAGNAGTASTARSPSAAGSAGAAGQVSAAGQGASASGNGASAPVTEAGSAATIPVDPAPADVSRYEEPGDYASMVESNAGPNRAYTIYRPSELGKDGFKHPIVTWGNGSGTTPSTYTQLLTHYATHGFVVVASNATDTGSGEEMVAGVDWLLEQHAASGGPYFDKLDDKAIAAVGYSQGGIGAVIAATDPRITTSIPIAGGDEKIDQIHGVTFLIGFANDTTVPPLWNMAPQFESAAAPAVYGVLQGGATHLEMLGDGGRTLGYTTAWLVLQLKHDNALSGVFYGPDCTLCKDMLWVVERKAVPGVDAPVLPTKDQCLADAPFPASASAECKECLCNSCPREAVQCTDVCWDLASCMLNECSSNPDRDIAHFACTGITANGTCGEHADGIRYTSALSVHAAGCMAPGKCLELCLP